MLFICFFLIFALNSSLVVCKKKLKKKKLALEIKKQETYLNKNKD